MNVHFEDNTIAPAVATHPGRILKRELEARGISQKEFAQKIGILPPNLNDLIHGRRNVTEQIAMKLEAALDIPFHIWMNLQNRHDYFTMRGVPSSADSLSTTKSPTKKESLKKQILAQLSLITDDDAALASCLKYMKNLVRQSKHQEVGTFVQEPPATYK